LGNRRVVKYRKPIRINIGVVIFSIIFIYTLIISVQYLTKEHITIYEVSKKSIADDNTCYGVIMRDETVYNTSAAGYINYYVGDGEKVAKNSTIYTLDESGQVYDMLASNDSEKEISSEDSEKIRGDILSFKKSYTDSSFNKVQDFKNNIDNTILNLANVNMLSNLNNIIKDNASSSTFQIVKSDQSGIISYAVDGMEHLTQQDISENTFKQSGDKETKQIITGTPLKAGSPVYKLITSEKWSIVIPLTIEQYKKVSDKTSVNIRFTKDNLSTSANITTFQNKNNYYAKLDLNKYMIHYADDRFVEIELIINSADGLKIPKSAILKKQFYLVPISYFTVGGEKDKKGLVKEFYSKNGNVEYKFIATDVYYEDKNYGYVDTKQFSAGDWLRNAQTQQRYKLSKTSTLEGVYNVNKGYCVFRRIEKEYENQEYCIIKENTSNGLSVFDHIVVNADSIKDQDILN
jgi:hypothetical protein